MITTEEFLKTLKAKELNPYRLAIVDEIVDSIVKIRFYGESKASNKQYSYLESCNNLIVGDKLLLASIGGTYIIVGKIITPT